MPPEGARLVWITHGDVSRAHAGDAAALGRLRDAFNDAAPEPVARRRCVVHDADHRADDGDHPVCWKWDFGEVDYNPPCRFVTEYAVPAPPEEPA